MTKRSETKRVFENLRTLGLNLGMYSKSERLGSSSGSLNSTSGFGSGTTSTPSPPIRLPNSEQNYKKKISLKSTTNYISPFQNGDEINTNLANLGNLSYINKNKSSVRLKSRGSKYYEFNSPNTQIKVVIRDGRIVEGRETLPNYSTKNNSSNRDKSTSRAGKTSCGACKKKCSGDVLRVKDKFFHINCFKCSVCSTLLSQTGFYFHENEYYCTNDYHKKWGTLCGACNKYVEGEIVTALGSTYHLNCFICARCRRPFPEGTKVTVAGTEVLCHHCVATKISTHDNETVSKPNSTSLEQSSHNNDTKCSACRKGVREEDVLVALDSTWHSKCFKCAACNNVLSGEYIGKEGKAYCEKDYQKIYGVKCSYCHRFISGKVLQAGSKHHFHPTCARCTKCGDPFGDGEEMYLQGEAIWHPRCGPGQNSNIVGLYPNQSSYDRPDSKLDPFHSCSVSETQFSFRSRTPSLNGSISSPHQKYLRASSPGLILREYKSPYTQDVTKIYTYSYLTAEPSLGYLRKPIDPYDKVRSSQHFHCPPQNNSSRGGMLSYKSKGGMSSMIDSIQLEIPRAKSPHMNNEEPIELAHFPAAKPPLPNELPKIERDDFPAPPYPYTDPERRKLWSDSYVGVQASDDEDEVDNVFAHQNNLKLKREEEELNKLGKGIGRVFLDNVKEREKIRNWKQENLDPRSSSRNPSASKEPELKLRYGSPCNASPSRYADHPKPWNEEFEYEQRGVAGGNNLLGKSGATSSYNIVSSNRLVPKPGYGLKSSTSLPAVGHKNMNNTESHPTKMSNNGTLENNLNGRFSESVNYSEFTNTALGGESEGGGYVSDKRSNGKQMRSSASCTGGEMSGFSDAQNSKNMNFNIFRRSLPDILNIEPLKSYPHHLLMTSNYRLPSDVDRKNLERHLSEIEFESVFSMTRSNFYQLPSWKRNELKRRAMIF